MGWPYIWKIIYNVITKNTTKILTRNIYTATKRLVFEGWKGRNWSVSRQKIDFKVIRSSQDWRVFIAKAGTSEELLNAADTLLITK